MSLAEAIYLLSALTSLVACILLWRYYLHRRVPLLLWSGIGFLGLAVNNVLVFVDLVVFVGTNLAAVRTVVGAVAMLVMLFGLIWEGHR